MATPEIHADLSVKRWGGKREDYLSIHEFLDSTKAAFPDNRHRAILHNSFACKNILPRIFGITILNSDGREVSVQRICEEHIAEDYNGKFVPSIQDFLQEMEYKPWMQNGLGTPPSHSKIYKKYTLDTTKTEEPTYLDGANRYRRFTTPLMDLKIQDKDGNFRDMTAEEKQDWVSHIKNIGYRTD